MVNQGRENMSLSREQLKLLSMLSRELTLPLSFVSQVNDLLLKDDLDNDERKRLSTLAKVQFDDYLNVHDTLIRIYTGAFEALPLDPLNPAVSINDALAIHSLTIGSRYKKIVLPESSQAVSLTHRAALTQAISALIRYSRDCPSESKAPFLEFKIKSHGQRIAIQMLDQGSQLTKAQVSRTRRAFGSYRQISKDSLTSGLHLAIADCLLEQIEASLDFQKLKGIATWTIGLPRSRQLALWP